MKSTDQGKNSPDGGVDASALSGDRIKERLRALGISERECSRRAGFGVGYVGDLISGRSKSPEMPRLLRLADVLGCDVDYLIGRQSELLRGDSQKGSIDAVQLVRPIGTPSVTTGQGLINLYAAAPLSRDAWFSVQEQPVDRVPALPHLTHVAAAYAFLVPTDHMEPRYLVGEVVYLHPTLAPRAKDFVFLRLRDGKATLGRIEDIDGEGVTLQYLTPPPEGATTRVPLADIDVLHRIVGSANH